MAGRNTAEATSRSDSRQPVLGKEAGFAVSAHLILLGTLELPRRRTILPPESLSQQETLNTDTPETQPMCSERPRACAVAVSRRLLGIHHPHASLHTLLATEDRNKDTDPLKASCGTTPATHVADAILMLCEPAQAIQAAVRFNFIPN